MSTLGAEFLRRLRSLLSRRGDLTLIYGVNEDSVALGKECLGEKNGAVVFVTESASAETVHDLNKAGMSVLTGPDAVASEAKVLRRLHIGRRKLTVYALDAADDKNLYYALRLKDALEKKGVPAERTRIALPGAEDIIGSMLQVSDARYGFGYVNVFDRSMLAARAVIRTVPPWDYVSFGPDGRALEDFECVIAGFGAHGQAALKQLVGGVAVRRGVVFRHAVRRHARPARAVGAGRHQALRAEYPCALRDGRHAAFIQQGH